MRKRWGCLPTIARVPLFKLPVLRPDTRALCNGLCPVHIESGLVNYADQNVLFFEEAG